MEEREDQPAAEGPPEPERPAGEPPAGEQPSAEPPSPETPVPEAAPSPPPAPPPPAAPAPAGELRRYLLTAAVTAGVLLFALAFFVAGFATRALLDEDDGGGSAGGSNGAATGVPELPPTALDDPAWGPEDAPVVIQEFSDFQCPYCARFFRETLPRIKEVYGDKVRFIYRDFPITSIHQYAQKAAEAAQCAHEQGRFWEYHDILFQNQAALSVPDLKRYAQGLGLDMAEFNDCLDSGRNAQEVLLDRQDGLREGVTGTPAFLINGVMVRGAQPFEQFQIAIEQALAAAGAR